MRCFAFAAPSGAINMVISESGAYESILEMDPHSGGNGMLVLVVSDRKVEKMRLEPLK